MSTPQVPPSQELDFRCTLATRWADEDRVGVLNNAIYLNLMEEARYKYFEARGLIEEEPGFGFLLGTVLIRFLAPGHGPAKVTVEMGTTRIGTRSFTQAYRVLGPDGTPWAEAEATMVWWDPATRSTCAAPQSFLDSVIL